MAEGRTISPDHILKEMSDLWVNLGKQGEGDAGVLRACSMTLVVAAEQSDDAQAIGETLAALMPEHPSRAIVVRFTEDAARTLAARVFAQCWMPFGHRQQICCEQIEITASDTSLPDLAPVVLPLAVPDLPVILWCRSPRLFHHTDFAKLSAIAQKVVVDSGAFPDQTAALRELSADQAAGHMLADLAWTRLTRWRELIAHIFENRTQLTNLPLVTDIAILYKTAATPTTAYYLGAWLLHGLDRLGVHPRIRFAAEAGEATGRLSLVELRAAERPDPILSITFEEGHAAEVRAGGLVSKTLLPPMTDYALMREDLSIPGHDPIFEHALALAAKLALS